MSSGLTARRLILQQLTAVAQHSPLMSPLAAVYANHATATASGKGQSSSKTTDRSWFSFLIRPEHSRGTFTLMTEEEVTYLRRRREEDGEEGRVVLSTRPTRSLIKGTAGCALNVLLSFLLSPILALSVALEAVRLRGARPVTLIVAPVVGLTWGAVFIVVAWYAALQQLVLLLLYQLEAPAVYLFRSGCCWNELACRYEYPSGVVGSAHPLLALHASADKLRERAMRRESRRRHNSSSSSSATYKGKGGGQSAHDSSDYYAVLGVSRDATGRQIKEAYNRLVLTVHPDKNPSKSAAAHFDAVTKAYRVLGNEEKRRKYDIGGKSGVEDIGEKKRDAVRALFGGDALNAIVGDVKTGSFSQRVVDGLDWTQEELAVCRQRMQERCRDELLTSYLEPLQNSSGSNAGLAELKPRLQRLLNTGLAKEVLYAVGQEYLRVAQYSEAAGPLQRLLLLQEVAPHRVRRRLEKWRCLARVRQHTFTDSAAMVDLAWYTSVEELECTARWVATAVLLDPKLTAEERRHRRDALCLLAKTFVAYGQPYKGANRQTMDSLMNSLREYQQDQQKRRSE
ncbi:putative chaperone protein DNAj [Trypanosoma grayi]|uniref:putative chaperone protein DNAj n=1 Tax=Trypanosoma grayi TaxID=71804 RepID=UPI0004F49E69|nr:putative chaperone protein DNAj [Trypanosoma grayi]KEG11082.1 putative chaperone protein DNAj [Trypanosoma grayi]